MMIRICLIILFLVNSNNISQAFPKKIKIDLNPNSFSNYQKKLVRASIEGDSINSKYKKWINGNIVVDNKKLKIKLKITGDWKDHIKMKSGRMFSSLSIKVLEDNYYGNTRFKLLLPETRYGNEHLFWNSMLNYLGYTTLKMQLINVQLNNINYKAFIEESPSKEFLESNFEREGPLMEFDERTHISNLKNYKSLRENVINKQVNIFSKKKYRDYNSPKIINKQYLKNFNSLKIASDAIYLFSQNNFEEFIDNSNFFYKISEKYASHGLSLNNRNFFYQPYKFKLFEIYKEGNVRLGGDLYKIKLCDLNDISKTYIKDFEKFIKNYKFDFEITNKMKCAFFDVKSIYEKENSKIKNPILNFQHKKTDSLINLTKKIKYFIDTKKTNDEINYTNELIQKYTLMYKDIFYLCGHNTSDNIINYCNVLIDKEYRDLISGDGGEYIYQNYKVYPINLGNLSYENRDQVIGVSKNNNIINLKNDRIYLLNLNGKENIQNLEFNFYNSNARLIIEGIAKNLRIKFKNINTKLTKNIRNNISKGRFNDKSLTGCVTFHDVFFQNVDLIAQDFFCEDAINIMNSKGSINEIEIKNSYFDGLDIDFSSISVENAIIEKSNNDCIDVSSGSYNIKKIKINSCGDKGISIGEKASFNSNDVRIKSTSFGVASKDSSVSKLNNLFIENSDICLSAYQKKQEFGGAFIQAKKIDCEGKNFYDKNSLISF